MAPGPGAGSLQSVQAVRTAWESGRLRIVIAGPPKAGNVWLKCIVGTMYGLRPLGLQETPKRPQYDLFRDWVDAGNFPDGTIFHQHYDYSEELADKIDAVPAHTITIIRDPYDTFVSSYHTIQDYVAKEGRGGRRAQIKNEPLDSEAVYQYLRQGGFRNNMKRAQAWVQSGRTHVVRYENLHEDPIKELTTLAGQIAPVSLAQIEHAIDWCSAENMRAREKGQAHSHVRVAKSGDSKKKLNDEHLAIFREKHAELITSLGYEVR